MATVWMALAALMALLHLALIVVLVVGGPVTLRWPRFVWVQGGITPGVNATILAAWLVPTIVAYTLRFRRSPSLAATGLRRRPHAQ